MILSTVDLRVASLQLGGGTPHSWREYHSGMS